MRIDRRDFYATRSEIRIGVCILDDLASVLACNRQQVEGHVDVSTIHTDFYNNYNRIVILKTRIQTINEILPSFEFSQILRTF